MENYETQTCRYYCRFCVGDVVCCGKRSRGDESVTTTVNGGVIHFKGEVVNAACAIDSESMNQTVELGQVRSSRLAKAGDLSSAVGFNIKLNDCDTNVSSNAAVAFLVLLSPVMTIH